MGAKWISTLLIGSECHISKKATKKSIVKTANGSWYVCGKRSKQKEVREEILRKVTARSESHSRGDRKRPLASPRPCSGS